MNRMTTAVATACALAVMSTEANAKIVQETVEVPVGVVDPRGKAINHRIKVTILRDDSKARSPFMILNHGRSGKEAVRARTRVDPYLANARYFVSKGFAVFMPVRVGYGESGGPDVEYSGSCAAKSYAPAYEAAAAQSLNVIAYARAQPYIDPGHGIIAGQSYGGTTAIALAAKSIPGVRAAVNFAAGGGGRPDTHPGQPCGVDRLTALFASYGLSARIPTLWFYSENDRFWGKELPRTWYQAFVDRGGVGRFVQLPSYKQDGHPIFTGNPAAWRPHFEEFLQSCCSTTPSGKAAAKAAPTPQRSSDTPEAFTQALTTWAARHGVKQAVVVVRREGRMVHQAGLGGADPAAPVLLASLSKAITGACVATLVRDGKLGLDRPLSKALESFFRAHGRPKDPRVERITVAQLLTHRAGFSSASDGDDPATRGLLEAYVSNHSTRAAPKPSYMATILGAPLLRDPGQAFAYSNGGYFVLGAVIEEAAGRSYETYCRDKVLVPAGAKGVLDPAWAVLSSAGGWRMSGADYLAFFEQFDPARATFGQAMRDWMLRPEGKTYGTSKPQSWYGPGVRLRDRGRGVEIWHTGSWRRTLAPDKSGPRSVGTWTFAMRVNEGTSWFVHHSAPTNLEIARADLIRELHLAYRSVHRWR